MAAFAETYDGTLSWEQILDVMVFVRSWGPVEALLPSGMSSYANAIGPLLTERCGACHGSSAGLTMTDYDALMAGSASGAVIVPGDPDESRIIEVQREEHYAQLVTSISFTHFNSTDFCSNICHDMHPKEPKAYDESYELCHWPPSFHGDAPKQQFSF